MLFIKAFTSYFHIYRPPTPPAVAYIIGLRQRRNTPPLGEKPPKSGFIRLARGWLAYQRDTDARATTAEERLYKRHPSVCTLSSQSDGTLP